jgi:hypothetical protein
MSVDLPWGVVISMGEVVYSTKWVKYSAQLQATTRNTTTTHNNQHEQLPVQYVALLLQQN